MIINWLLVGKLGIISLTLLTTAGLTDFSSHFPTHYGRAYSIFHMIIFCFSVVQEIEEEIYDKVVDLTEYAKRQRWWNRLFGKNSGPIAEKYSVATQIAIGGVSGW